MKMSKVVSAEEAVSHIKDGAIIAINGMLYLGQSKPFYEALEARYLTTGSPKGLTIYGALGLGHTQATGTPPDLVNRLAHKGLVAKIIDSHFGSFVEFNDLIENNEIEAYIATQGILAENLHCAARKAPGVITPIGLKTFVDPRYGGGALNESSKDELCEIMTIDGEEYLFFRTIYPDVCVVRGTTADLNGNVTCEKEATLFDPLVHVQAVKNSGGLVIVQVERLSGGYADPKLVKIPGKLIDYIIVDPKQKQMNIGEYNPYYTGEVRASKESILESMKSLIDSLETRRPAGDRIIVRRAALEIRKGDIVNLGLGIPMNVGVELTTMNRLSLDDFSFTVEVGTFGGVPAGDAYFGASVNTDMIFNQWEQFEFYQGGGINITFVGAMQVSASGHVNVVGVGSKIKGVGGFNYVTQMADRVTFCTKFLSGSGYNKTESGLKPYDKGVCKFADKVDYISFNSEIACKNKQYVIYVTERCVFELTPEGLMLTEISPYVDLEKDILAHMNFKPIISKDLKKMDDVCFLV